MNDPLTAESILDAAELTLRRFGPRKTTVVDVARALGVSHGAVYRHFPSKEALREAVARRWLARITGPLAAIAERDGTATERLHAWLSALAAAKRSKVLDDPELFAGYAILAEETRDVVSEHVAALVGQLAGIVESGVAEGEFRAVDPDRTAAALFDATVRFHHPAHAYEWLQAPGDEALNAVLDLLLDGLRA